MSSLATEVEILTKHAAGLKGVEILLADHEGDRSDGPKPNRPKGQTGGALEEVPNNAVSVTPVVKPLTVEERKGQEEDFLHEDEREAEVRERPEKVSDEGATTRSRTINHQPTSMHN